MNCRRKAEQEKIEQPKQWSSWPCWTYWLPGKPEEYLQDLIAIGAWDNEQVQKALTFIDKIVVCRNLFFNAFPDGPNEYNPKLAKVSTKDEDEEEEDEEEEDKGEIL